MYQVERPDLLSHFLQTEAIGFALKALDGRYVYVNRFFAEILGAADGSRVIGHDDSEMLPPNIADTFRLAQRRVQSNGEPVDIELEVPGRECAGTAVVVTHFPVDNDASELEAVGIVALPVRSDRGPAAPQRNVEAALHSAEKVNRQLHSTVRALQEIASTDGLTGAWNRRHCDGLLGSETDRSIRFGHPLSLLLIDLDFFKRVNDRFGHQAGDRVLVEFADCLRDGMRRSDALGRWGGEEFILLLPNTTLAGAQVLAERIRERVEACDFTCVGKLTASIGVAEFAPTESSEEWLARADHMLYRAKQGGRNRVEVDASVASVQAAEQGEANFVRLVWKSRFGCGHPTIDRQHRRLFDACNEILGAVVSGQPRTQVQLLIERLIDSITQHFHDEERLLAEIGFENLVEHKQEHATLMARALEMAEGYRDQRLSVGQLFEFIAHDMVARHVLGADRQYFSLLRKADGQ